VHVRLLTDRRSFTVLGMTATTRARSPEQRDARRSHFLATALRLLADRPYDEVSMRAVAQATGLAKGTAYLYFESKEDLFLSATEELLDDWFDEIDAWLERVEVGLGTAAAFADVVAESLARRPELPRLLAILHVTFEANIGYERALAFKQRTRAHFLRTAPLLERRLPALAPGDGVRVLMRLHALVIGLVHIAAPAPVIREVVTAPELAMFDVDFREELAGALRALLGAA
jgi:AcrR family transcriptional regulator